MIKGKVAYISGPCTGLPENNYPAFHAEAARLRAMGLRVENPAENPEPPCKSWSGYMRMALMQLLRSDVIVLLPGWHKSKGATVEHFVAACLGMPVYRASEICPEIIHGSIVLDCTSG